MANRHDVQHITYALSGEKKPEKKKASCFEILGQMVMYVVLAFFGIPLLCVLLEISVKFWSRCRHCW